MLVKYAHFFLPFFLASSSVSFTFFHAGAQVCDDTIFTTFAGGSGEDGNMFNITAINSIEITQFEGNIDGNGGIQVYYKVGTYQGNENNSGAWTFINSVTVTSNGIGVPTPILITINVTIPAGQTYAFYITGNGTGATLDYTNGTQEDTVYVSDANLQIREGIGIKYPFFTTFTPKVWNGIVHYSPIISTNVTNTDISCNGYSDGTAVVSVSGGTIPYDYLWSTGANTDSISGLSAGSYSVTVTDTNGCFAIDSLTILQPASATLSFSTTAALCPGICDGIAIVTPTGGTAPYAYLWDDGQTDSAAVGLCAGSYMVTVTDTNGCAVNGSISVSASYGVSLSFTTADAACGACDGFAVVTPSGGIFPYIYLWDDPMAQTDSVANNLCTDSYSVSVTDSNGCNTTDNVFIQTATGFNLTQMDFYGAVCGTCNGYITVSAAAGSAPYTYLWNNGQTSSKATGLCAGIYMVTVTDAMGCIETGTYTVPGGTIDSISFITSNATCGACDGIATVTAYGGSSPYSYLWSNGKSTASVSNLCPGINTVYVTDGNRCGITYDVIISGTSGISIAFDSSDASCGACDGTAIVTPTGGTAPYTYLWSDGQIDSTASGLCVGDYTVFVEDVSGCPEIGRVTISEPSPISLSFSLGDESACSSCNGWAQVTASGGTGHTYLWSNGQTGTTATGLCFGTYTVTVTNADSCTITESISIATVSGGPVLTDNTNTTLDFCGACNGTAEVYLFDIGGTTLPVTYVWSDGQTTASGNVGGLCTGNYSVTATEANGCSYTMNNIFISGTVGVSSLAFSTTDASCGLCDGTATVTTTGGTPPYTYSWSNGQTNSSASNLCVGSHAVTVTDVYNCSLIDTAYVITPSGMSLMLSTIDASCGVCNGSAIATPTGGTTPYTYLWSDGQTDSTASSLCFGYYSVTVTDVNGCQVVEIVSISQQFPVSLSFNSADAACGACDGSVSVTASSSAPPHTFLWNTGDTAANLTNICAGTYTVTVTNNSGCIVVDSITISGISSYSIINSVNQTNSVSCYGGSDGAVEIRMNYPSALWPYDIFWSSGDSSFGVFDTVAVFTGLSGGTHFVTVTDANDCSETVLVTVTEPDSITINIIETDANCGSSDGSAEAMVSGGVVPYTYNWSSGGTGSLETDLSAGIYLVTITDAIGCINSAQAVINNIGGTVITLDSIENTSCAGGGDGAIYITVSGGTLPYTYSWSNSATVEDINNLTAGTYSVTVTDVNNCQTISSSIIISEPPAIILSANADSIVSITCNSDSNGMATVAIISGGTAPYDYIWSSGGSVSGSTDTTNNETDLSAGTYLVTVTDSNGCTAVDSVTITEPPTMIFTMGSIPDISGTGDGKAWVNVTGGTPPYNYLWNDPALQTTDTAYGLTVGNYTVVVTDNNGCQDSSNVTVGSVGLAPVADFTADYTNITVGDSINFFDLTANTPTSWSWIFTNGNPTSSNAQNPVNIKYNTSGSYEVTLTSTNAFGTDTKIKTGYINVSLGTGVEKFEFTHGEFRMYPNPNTGQFTLEVDLKENTELNFKVYHFTGELIYSEGIGNVSGNYTQQIDLSGYSKGVYFLQISTEDNVRTRKVVLY